MDELVTLGKPVVGPLALALKWRLSHEDTQVQMRAAEGLGILIGKPGGSQTLVRALEIAQNPETSYYTILLLGE